jgi:hypothetical protein
MTLSHNETKEIIDNILETPAEQARRVLNITLKKRNRAEPEFYAGVIAHGPGMKYTSEQWFSFFKKVPIRIFLDEPKLMNKLSDNQRALLLQK